jgi:glycosyltransferase involved in cell wall biosynthesis
MNKAPLILHIFPTFEAAGSQVRSVTIANALGAEFAHTVISLSGNCEAAKRFDPKLAITLLPPPRVKTTSLRFPLAMRSMLRALRPNLVITHNWGSIDAVVGARLAAVCPTIHIEDGFAPDEAMKFTRRRVLTRRLLLNRIHQTIVPSKTLLDIASRQYRLRPDKVRYIPNGVMLGPMERRQRAVTRCILGADENTLVAGYLGHLRPEKNIDVLMRAFAAARLKNARLVVVGDGQSKSSLTKLAFELGLLGRIIFTGATETPRQYLEAFDIFVMSSYTEQLPLSLLEAMAAGLPVVCTAAGDTPEVLGSAEARFVVPIGDVRAFTAALSAVAGDAGLRERLGRENRRRCETDYSQDSMVQAHASLYRAAIASHSGSH